MLSKPDSPERRLVALSWVAQRWACSRQTCRRVLARNGVRPIFLGGDARNATIRFDVADILGVEVRVQVPDVESTKNPRPGVAAAPGEDVP